jgi:KaiC/GvpD/RAD55 family RecA-like ATPase
MGDDGHEVLADATSVLLLTPAVRDAGASAAATLFEQGSKPHDRVVAVTVSQSAERWVQAWKRHAGPLTEISCIDVDDGTRSARTADGGCATMPVEQVASPSNLETLGRTVSNVLERASDDDERVGLAVHSVTDLLHHVDEPTVFKFVYTLGEVVRRTDGTVYFHLDAGAHGTETVNTFAAACDAIVELDGDVTVREQSNW